MSEKPILILDLGSTSARALVISTQNFDIIGRAKYEVHLKLRVIKKIINVYLESLKFK